MQQNDPNTLKKPETPNKRYMDWFTRFKRIHQAWKLELIKERDLEKFQLFLLQTGQFNANFTLDELNRLRYPLSPFAPMHRHTYLRSVETWALEMLRHSYQKELHPKKLFPIFVHSALFFEELTRYFQVLRIDVREKGGLQSFLDNGMVSDTPLWIELRRKEDAVSTEENIKKHIEPFLLKKIIRQHSISDDLIPTFDAIRVGAQLQSVDDHVMRLLNCFFPEIERDSSNKHTELIKSFNIADNSPPRWTDKKWFDKICGQARKYRIDIPATIKNSLDLLEDASQPENKENFLAFLDSVKQAIKPALNVGSYRPVILKWLTSKVNPVLQAFLKKVVYFSQDEYQTIPTLVLHNRSSAPDFVNSAMGNLGYRIDPVQAIRLLIKNFYPSLFIDLKETQDFWSALMCTAMLKLPDDEKKKISNLGNAVFEEIASNTPDDAVSSCLLRYPDAFSFNTNLSYLLKRHFNDDLANLTSGLHTEVSFAFYAAYIERFLNSYQEKNVSNHALRYVVDDEIDPALNNFMEAADEDNLAKAVRWAQVISEIEILHLEFSPPEQSLSAIVKEQYLSGFPVQKVMITPYAMRAFVRVFQILREKCPSNPTIFVTNQGYFELLHNLEEMNKQRASVFFVQTVQEINEKADIIFLELHPNNIASSQQFEHDIGSLLRTMQRWQKKPRTVVLDLTLNMLNENKIKILLKQAESSISDGLINLIIIQSLTKFCQLGLDQRSAGMVIVINNNDHWQLLPAMEQIEKEEPVDRSTINFFISFINSPPLLLNYVSVIKRNCYEVYVDTLQELDKLKTHTHDRCQLTVSSDRGACYVGLNMRGLVSAADNAFSLNSENIEAFLEEMLTHLIFPLCDSLRLPLTARMSIGFPLSSVNVVFDSLRITIGLESREQLKQYANIFAYCAFLINNQKNIQAFFPTDTKKRIDYFKEKKEQYILTDRYNRTGSSFIWQAGDDEFEITSNDYGNISLCKRGDRTFIAKFNICFYSSFVPYGMRVKIGGELLLLKKLDSEKKRMFIASLSSMPEYQNIDYTISNSTIELHPNLPAIRKDIYGPYCFDAWKSQVYFLLDQENRYIHVYSPTGRAACLNPTGLTMFYEDRFSLFKKGNVFLTAYDLTYEEIEYLIREGAYAHDPNASLFITRIPPPGILYKDIHKHCGNLRITGDETQIIVEHDEICYLDNGITIYKRNCGASLTAIEIDYWLIKDPFEIRFLTLMIAVFARNHQNKNIDFLARNNRFSQFLFHIPITDADIIFKEAAQAVLKSQSALIRLLKSPPSPSTDYSFISPGVELKWPSGHIGIDRVQNNKLIETGLQRIRDMNASATKDHDVTSRRNAGTTCDDAYAESIQEENRHHSGSSRDSDPVSYKNSSTIPQQLSNPNDQEHEQMYEETVGDGNCFFHAAFATTKASGQWKTELANAMRHEWAEFLKQFNGLADHNMPELVKTCVRNALGRLFSSPQEGGEAFKDTVTPLKGEIEKQLALAKTESDKLKNGIQEKIQAGAEEITAVFCQLILDCVNREDISEEYQLIRDKLRGIFKLVLSIEAYPVQHNQSLIVPIWQQREALLRCMEDPNCSYLKDHIAQELKKYAVLFKQFDCEDAYDRTMNEQVIFSQFTDSKEVYQAYCQAIQLQSYFVLSEEIPLLASLSNVTIHIWYQEKNGQFCDEEIKPDLPTRASIPYPPRLACPWIDLAETHIYHDGFSATGKAAGQHYSRAKAGSLQNPTVAMEKNLEASPGKDKEKFGSANHHRSTFFCSKNGEEVDSDKLPAHAESPPQPFR